MPVVEDIVIDESIILKPYTYLYDNSKEPRMAAVIQDFNRIINAPQEAVEVTCEVTNMIERCIMLTDDVIDNSEFREKTPTAHQVFGVPHSLSASWYSFFMCTERLLALKQPKAVELVLKNMKDIWEGQTMEVIYRDSFQCPTEEEWHQIAMKKSGSFMAIFIGLLQFFAKDDRDLTKLNEMLAFYYTALDDTDDLRKIRNQVENYYEDINEGKFGFPLVIAINRHPGKLDKSDIAAGMADKTSRGSYIQSLLKESDAFVCCQKILSELETKIRKELNALGASAIADSLLKFRYDP